MKIVVVDRLLSNDIVLLDSTLSPELRKTCGSSGPSKQFFSLLTISLWCSHCGYIMRRSSALHLEQVDVELA